MTSPRLMLADFVDIIDCFAAAQAADDDVIAATLIIQQIGTPIARGCATTIRPTACPSLFPDAPSSR